MTERELDEAAVEAAATAVSPYLDRTYQHPTLIARAVVGAYLAARTTPDAAAMERVSIDRADLEHISARWWAIEGVTNQDRAIQVRINNILDPRKAVQS